MSYSKSGGKNCVIIGCHNNQKKLHSWNKSVCKDHEDLGLLHEDCPCMTPFSLHCIPKNEDRRRAWLRAINRKDFEPKTKELVCSLHFVNGRPTKLNPDPSLHLGYEREVKQGRRPLIRVPLSNVASNYQEDEPGYTCITGSDVFLEDVPPTTTTSVGLQTDAIVCHIPGDVCSTNVMLRDMSTQTEDFISTEHSYSFLKPTCKSTSTQHTTAEFSCGILKTDSDSRFYTGLTLTVLLSLISCLSPLGKKLSFRLPISDQIFLTLVRLRLGIAYKDIARRFNISYQLANRIFLEWITIMAENMKDCVLWLPRDTIKRIMPRSFIDSYPKTTCVIDCFEIFIQRPFSLKARGQTWSTYKSHNTVKFLLAIAPNGYIMYISRAYGGRASDNFITKSSTFLNNLLPGDEVMADRGFTIGDELFARRVKLNIPDFMKGRQQLTEKETIESRRIASVRIHVERAIARIKTHRILNTTIPVQSMKFIDRILTVCAALCNLHGELIREEHID